MKLSPLLLLMLFPCTVLAGTGQDGGTVKGGGMMNGGGMMKKGMKGGGMMNGGRRESKSKTISP
jgi:hypothetical protein